MPRPLRVINLTSSLIRYAEGLCLQNQLAEQRRNGVIGDTLVLLQHFPVYTLGKRGKPSDFRTPQKELEATGVDVCFVERGGEVTFHGPGQLVAYPIVGVRQAGFGARAYVESLEGSIIDCLAGYGIAARGRVAGATGVWVGERKIAAIGVRISHGVRFGTQTLVVVNCGYSAHSHGLALNIDTDLSYFKHIVPCGIPDKEVTSIRLEFQTAGEAVGLSVRLEAELLGAVSQVPKLTGERGSGPNFDQVVEDFMRTFRNRLGFESG